MMIGSIVQVTARGQQYMSYRSYIQNNAPELLERYRFGGPAVQEGDQGILAFIGPHETLGCPVAIVIMGERLVVMGVKGIKEVRECPRRILELDASCLPF